MLVIRWYKLNSFAARENILGILFTCSMSVNEKNPDLASDATSQRDLEYEFNPMPFVSEKDKDAQVEQLATEYAINHTRLMWKIDICVVPPLALLYFLAFLDRVNISNAKVYGIEKALNLKSHEFNTCLTLFFVPYVFFEVFSNYAIKYIKPHIWLSGCILFFGAVTIGMGFSRNFGDLAACRFLLGVFESGSFPAIFYILGNFYAKAESQRRFSTFFSCTCLAGAAGGAIAYKIKDLDGRYGIESWQWIFIVEGAFTAGLAFVLFFIIPDFPENCRFLSENERVFLKKKLEVYNGQSGFEVKHTLKDVAGCFKDPMIWITALAYFGLIIPAYGYAYFATSIIKVMGYTGEIANQKSVYPWVCAFGYSIVISFVSDWSKIRLPFALVNCLIAIIGLALVLGCTENVTARYAGCFLSATGLYSAMPILICWSTLNYGGHVRKGTGSAFLVGFGNIGGIISTYIFLAPDAPRYIKGLSISIAFVVFAMVFIGLYFALVMKRNSDKQKEAYQLRFSQLSEKEKIMKGDLNPRFQYYY